LASEDDESGAITFKGYLIAGNAAPEMGVLGPGRIAWRKDILHTERRHR
jgi:hypothetical protein